MPNQQRKRQSSTGATTADDGSYKFHLLEGAQVYEKRKYTKAGDKTASPSSSVGTSDEECANLDSSKPSVKNARTSKKRKQRQAKTSSPTRPTGGISKPSSSPSVVRLRISQFSTPSVAQIIDHQGEEEVEVEEYISPFNWQHAELQRNSVPVASYEHLNGFQQAVPTVTTTPMTTSSLLPMATNDAIQFGGLLERLKEEDYRIKKQQQQLQHQQLYSPHGYVIMPQTYPAQEQVAAELDSVGSLRALAVLYAVGEALSRCYATTLPSSPHFHR